MWFELLSCVVGLLWFFHYQRKNKLPDGPFSIPILGTTELFTNRSRSLIGLFFQEKFQIYKDFCTFFVGNSSVIVLINDFKLVKELFAMDEFSGRSKSWFHRNIRGYNGRNLGIITTEGPIWKEQRRFALTNLRDLGFGRKSLDSSMIEEVDQVIDQLLYRSSQNKDGIVEIRSTFNTAIINVLWQIVASKKFDPDHPDTKKIMDMLNLHFQTGGSSNHWTNFFPALKQYLPLSHLDKNIIKIKSIMENIISEHLQDIDYDNPRDFIDVYLTQMQTNDNFDAEHLVVTCLDFFQAGAETTSTTLLWSVLFMALHPDVQAKCQAEIRDEIGSRPPTMDDLSKLTYALATLNEIQRLSVVAPGSLAHVLTKDTVVKNYIFRKGTTFIANLTKFLLDPDVFPAPKCFKPERFIDEHGKIKRIEQFAPFGIGKRICMGESLAKNELFLFFVRLLQRLTFEETDKKPSVDNVFHGITRIPKPFSVKLVSN